MAGHINNHEIIRKHQLGELTVSAVDALDISFIFTMFAKQTYQLWLESYFKYALFPIAAAANIIKALLAWRGVAIERNEQTGKVKTNLVLRAMVETLVAAAITVAVVGGLAFASIFSSVSPIIFTAALAAKSFYHLLASVYYFGKASAATTLESKKENRNLAVSNAVIGAAVGLTSAAVALVMIVAKPFLAPLGILAGLIGASFAIVKLTNLSGRAPQEGGVGNSTTIISASPDGNHSNSSTKLISQTLSNNQQNQVTTPLAICNNQPVEAYAEPQLPNSTPETMQEGNEKKTGQPEQQVDQSELEPNLNEAIISHLTPSFKA